MKKDVLFLCQFFYPEHNSSATLPFDTASYLASHGLTVDALVGYPKEYSDAGSVPMKETQGGVGIHRIRYIQLARGKKLSRLINYISFTASSFLHLFKLRKYKCVVVYSNPPILPMTAVVANMLFKTKIVFVAYDIYPEVAFASGNIRKGSILERGMSWINRMLYKRAARVVALTDEMKAYLLEHRPQLTADRVVTIANWAHEKKTEATDSAYRRFGYEPGQFIVSYFGNMGICQEMATLVSAIQRLRENDRVRFLMIGHGNKKEGIEAYFKSLGVQNVQMHDFLTGEAFEQAVAITSCSVLSLDKGLKGMCAPSKYYSYLQGGKPVIAVVERGSYLEEEIRREEIGAAVTIGDVDELVGQILSMVEHPEQTAAQGQRALALYERAYSTEIGLAKYKAMLDELL